MATLEKLDSIEGLLELLHDGLVKVLRFGSGVALVLEVFKVLACLLSFLKCVVFFALLVCLSQNVATHLAQYWVVEGFVAVQHSYHHLCEHD